jgi:4-diphosphocytidyl-2-C-methyl-D-erythritol kinase
VILEKQSFAKVNLFLKVTGKRADGFHTLCSLMAPIDLCDRVNIQVGGRGVTVSCDHPDVPGDHTNLAARAARVFMAACEKKTAAAPSRASPFGLKKRSLLAAVLAAVPVTLPPC